MTGRTILVVEDEALIALDIEMTLAGSGFDNIAVCNSVAKAMQRLDVGTPLAALLDLNLGGGQTSVEIALRLQEMNCPFAFLTGYTATTVPLPAALSETVRIAKPFDDAELLSCVRELANPA